MITRLVSSKEIVAKAIADYNLQEDEIKITDIKSWIAEGMELIGSVNQMDHKVEVLHIHDYQCKLPCDLQRLNSVAFSFCENGGWFPAKRTTGTFSVFDKKHNEVCCKIKCCFHWLKTCLTLLTINKRWTNLMKMII